MKEYKIIKPKSLWSFKDTSFEDVLNTYGTQGWRVVSVAYGGTGNILKAVLERDKNRM
jgi:hypothetical protein